MDDFTHLWLLRARRREHLMAQARNPVRMAPARDGSRPRRDGWSWRVPRWHRLVRRPAA